MAPETDYLNIPTDGWVEDLTGWSFTTSEDQGLEGKRRFIRRTGPCDPGIATATTENLPQLGDPFKPESEGAEEKELRCNLTSIEYSWKDTFTQIADCTYNSKNRDRGDGDGENYEVDKLPRSLSLSPEFLQIKIGAEDSKGEATEVGKKLFLSLPPVDKSSPHTSFSQYVKDAQEQPTFVAQNITGTLRITQVVKDLSELSVRVARTIGKLNKEIMYGFPKGTVLYNGMDSEEFFNSVGWRRWRCEHHFGIKLGIAGVQEDGTVIVAGYNYIFRPDLWKWDLIYYDALGTGATLTRTLYGEADLLVDLGLTKKDI